MELTEITEKLHDTQGEITYLQGVIAQNPNTPLSVLSMLRSFEQRQEQLETAFAEATNQRYLDVISYRLFNDTAGSPSISSLASALTRFQTLFTVVYDALDGAKKTSRVTADALAATTLTYGYTFAGSVGFVMTLPNERLLLDETELDKAMDIVFTLAKADSSDQVAEFAKRLGPAPIREMYKWAETLVDNGLGADIDWRRESDVKAHLVVRLPDLRSLKDAIIETSDDIIKTRRLTGTLIGIDIVRHTFRMTFGKLAEVRGKMSESIGKVEVPQRYAAEIRTTTRLNYATGKEETDHYLVSLGPPA